MCATNPKKKRQYATKGGETKATTTDAAKGETTLSTGDSSSSAELIYKYVGSTILTKANSLPKPTAEVLKGKDLIGFYFAASWYVTPKMFFA